MRATTSLVLSSCSPGSAPAQVSYPMVTHVMPVAVQRGKTTTVKVVRHAELRGHLQGALRGHRHHRRGRRPQGDAAPDGPRRHAEAHRGRRRETRPARVPHRLPARPVERRPTRRQRTPRRRREGRQQHAARRRCRSRSPARSRAGSRPRRTWTTSASRRRPGRPSPSRCCAPASRTRSTTSRSTPTRCSPSSTPRAANSPPTTISTSPTRCSPTPSRRPATTSSRSATPSTTAIRAGSTPCSSPIGPTPRTSTPGRRSRPARTSSVELDRLRRVGQARRVTLTAPATPGMHELALDIGAGADEPRALLRQRPAAGHRAGAERHARPRRRA